MSRPAFAADTEADPSESDAFVAAVLERMAAVLPPEDGPYPLHEPHIDGAAWSYVKDCLDSGWVSSVGEYVRWFEEKLVETTGATHAVATVSGTAALHICMLLAGVQRDDEVLVPPLTFVASANAIHYCGAHPHFVDVEPVSLGVDPTALTAHLERIAEMRGDVCFNSVTGRPIRGLLVVHCFGHPARIAELAEVAARFNIVLIEDAAEALGTSAGNRSAGCHGKVAALSFNGNKTVTTGGGGAILTDDDELAELALHLTTTARVDDPFVLAHDMVAFNYRMPNLNAALGCAQLEQLPELLAAKRQLAARWREAFAGLGGLRFIDEPSWGKSNFWLNALSLDPPYATRRPQLLAALDAAGYHCRPFWTPLHRLPMYQDRPMASLQVADDLAARGFNLPSSAGLIRPGVPPIFDKNG
ncbi:MAG: LegC family aminotransferase [Alphaproteobacteria bacterium]|nr:LegC family aminotransferase [Alphaproteobacteria bacterium]